MNHHTGNLDSAECAAVGCGVGREAVCSPWGRPPTVFPSEQAAGARQCRWRGDGVPSSALQGEKPCYLKHRLGEEATQKRDPPRDVTAASHSCAQHVLGCQPGLQTCSWHHCALSRGDV